MDLLSSLLWVFLAFGVEDGSELKAPEPPPAQEAAKVVAIEPAVQQPRWRGEPISLSLKDADLREVLRSFARLTDMNLILDPAVQGKVTVELTDVPWDQALWAILKIHRLGVESQGRLWIVERAVGDGKK